MRCSFSLGFRKTGVYPRMVVVTNMSVPGSLQFTQRTYSPSAAMARLWNARDTHHSVAPLRRASGIGERATTVVGRATGRLGSKVTLYVNPGR